MSSRHKIQDPNTSGQGYCADHADNPFHDTLVGAGFKYSHTTPVGFRDGEVLHHTYAHGQRKCGVHDHNGWEWNSKIRSGSGHETSGSTVEALRKHLRNVVRGGRG